MKASISDTTQSAVQQQEGTLSGKDGREPRGKDSARHRSRTGIVAVVAIGMLGLGVAVWFIVSGMVTIVWSGTGQKQVTSTYVVCDESVVASYNKAALYELRPGSELPTLDTEALKGIVADVESRSGHENDPTCQNIIFWQAVNNSDYAAAQRSLTAIKELHGKRLYPDNNVMNIQGISGYDEALEAINPERSQPTSEREM